MAIAESCGHDRRGNETEQDDINEIANQFNEWKKKVNLNF
jgi:type I restriction enzyme M protein